MATRIEDGITYTKAIGHRGENGMQLNLPELAKQTFLLAQIIKAQILTFMFMKRKIKNLVYLDNHIKAKEERMRLSVISELFQIKTTLLG